MVSSSGAIVEAGAMTNGQLLIGSTSVAPVIAALTGTTNDEVIVTNGAGSITLSLPQAIATTLTPTFASETLTATTNQLLLYNTTLTAPASSAFTLTLPSATDTLVGQSTTDTLNNKTLVSPVINGTISGTTVIPLANGGTGTGSTAGTTGSTSSNLVFRVVELLQETLLSPLLNIQQEMHRNQQLQLQEQAQHSRVRW